jgi:FeS assembly SUF system protein
MSEPTGGTGFDRALLEKRIVLALKTVYDPEIPVDIWELGLIYGIDIAGDASVTIRMTLTAPACPAAEMLPPEVEQKVAAVEGVASARVEIVWEPTWNKDMISEAAKLQLGFF